VQQSAKALSAAQRDAEAARAAAAQSRDAASSVGDERAAMEAAVRRLREEVAALQTALDEAKGENSRLHGSVRSMREEMTRLMEDGGPVASAAVDSAKRGMQELEARRDELEADLLAARAEIEVRPALCCCLVAASVLSPSSLRDVT
jgi:predicted RNase H-like nuclease (RuvC/YqgF family)